MRKYASAEERATKNQKMTVRHFGFTEKVYVLPCTVCTLLIAEAPSIEMPSREYVVYLRRAIAVDARQRRAASASIP